MLRRIAGQHDAVIANVVRVLVPAFPSIDGAARVAVESEVTAFVASQVRAMPSFLRIPYLAVLTVFDWLPLLRHGRPFRALPLPAQAAYLALWSNAPLRPMRDFVKLLRSCALLAYFDHPQVRQRLETGAAPASATPGPRVIQLR